MEQQNPNYRTIPLTQGKIAIVDAERYDALMKFSWRAVRAKHNWYAKANSKDPKKPWTISMHRFIARTPSGMVTHHINGNSLDNRKINLENQSKLQHTQYHANNSIRRKFETTPTKK